jgi:hypothetical protein
MNEFVEIKKLAALNAKSGKIKLNSSQPAV